MTTRSPLVEFVRRALSGDAVQTYILLDSVYEATLFQRRHGRGLLHLTRRSQGLMPKGTFDLIRKLLAQDRIKSHAVGAYMLPDQVVYIFDVQLVQKAVLC